MTTTLGRDTELTWLGHSTFQIRTPGGKTLLVDPWLSGNPACPQSFKDQPPKADALLLTHAHGDHISDAVEIGRQTGTKIVSIFEIYLWLANKKGVPGAIGMNKGGTIEVVDGVKATMVHALHSCGIQDGDQVIYGGEACGWVIRMENGFTVYHAGDTMIFSDMQLIAELWQPDLALLPIGDFYTMDPRQAARAARMLGVKHVIPMHWGTFEALPGKPEHLRQHLQGTGIEVLELQPGGSVR